jgi:hypothetical protein
VAHVRGDNSGGGAQARNKEVDVHVTLIVNYAAPMVNNVI